MARPAAAFALCATIAAALCSGCLPKPRPTQTNSQRGPTMDVRTQTTSPAKKTYTRAEFKSLVMGMNQDEVLKVVGKPDRTIETVNSFDWYYYKATTDPITGKVDWAAHVRFEDGVVIAVTF